MCLLRRRQPEQRLRVQDALQSPLLRRASQRPLAKRLSVRVPQPATA